MEETCSQRLLAFSEADLLNGVVGVSLGDEYTINNAVAMETRFQIRRRTRNSLLVQKEL